MSLFQPKALDLPVEVTEMIVNWLHRRSDLLSLALSHSKFYQVIVPDHLHYRQADFCIFDYAMWNHLLEDPRRLGKLEVLNLSAQRRPRAPPIRHLSGNETEDLAHADKVTSDFIRSAFKGMPMLHTVIWCSYGFAECQRPAMTLHISMWEAINKYCPTVRRVDDLGHCNSWSCYTEIAREARSPLENLSGISTFTFQAQCSQHTWPVNTYFSFLSLFQRLQHLTFLAPHSGALDIPQLLSMKFPLLESFTVKDLTRHVGMTLVLAFLAAHPLLHTFVWSTIQNAFTPHPLNTSAITSLDVAPRLERLVSPLKLVQRLFHPSFNGSGVRRPLKSLCTTLPLDTRAPPEDLILLSGIGSHLEELTVGDQLASAKWSCPDLGAGLRIVSSAFPNLRLLDLGSVSPDEYPVAVGGPHPKAHDWMSALSGLRYLVALIIPWSQGTKNSLAVRSSPSNRRHQTMEHLLARCPRLRFLFCRPTGSRARIPASQGPVAILIGHNDADVRFRKARLIDEGSSGDRKWAAYEGKQCDLTEEISMAVKARG